MSPEDLQIGEYKDELHAEDLDGLLCAEHDYKHRLLDGIMMPPYITPRRYQVSRTLETQPGDICYTSYPKSGSTWLAYILVLIVNNGEAPADMTLRNCVHWVASSWTYPRNAEELSSLPTPRIFKSHMPYQMALGGVPAGSPCKHIYIARNPKDVAVSYYFFERDKSWSGGYSGSWDHWFKIFCEGNVQRGCWFDHARGWWQASQAPNIMFLRYEDLCRDFHAQVDRLAGFLNHPLRPEVVETIHRKTTFQAMSSTEFSNMHEIRELNGFFRKGKIGSWREQFTPEQSAAFDELYARKMAGTGLEFDYT